jgi:hypothetical protein
MFIELLNCKNAVLAGLKEINAKLITIEFSGCGDSGECNSVSITGDKGCLLKAAEAINVAYVETSKCNWNPGKTSTSTEKTETLLAAVENLAYMELSNTAVDWYNNEGGAATWILDLENGVQHLTVDVNEIKSSNEYDNGMPTIETWMAE